MVISSPSQDEIPTVRLLDDLTDSWAGSIEFVQETDEQLRNTVHCDHHPHGGDRVRFASHESVPDSLRISAAAQGIYLADEPVLAEGRIELLWYLREQSISWDYHRYGNPGSRADEARRQPL
jgi:RHH-type proline utilization regulon transcriptional repressor/proline dehydrogenase/delta 1-pyrroline-5-carboxylate dehydrogenase